MMTPHDTAQYGHVLRVSVVRAIFSSRISARALLRSNPRVAPPLTAAPSFKKVRRFTGTPPAFRASGHTAPVVVKVTQLQHFLRGSEALPPLTQRDQAGAQPVRRATAIVAPRAAIAASSEGPCGGERPPTGVP